MKRILILGVVLLLISCSKSDQILFEMNVEAEFVIQPGLGTLDTHYFTINQVPTRIKTYVPSGDFLAIGKILPNRAEIRSHFDPFDFSIVQEVSIWAISARDPNLRKEIFYQDRVNFSEQKELRLFSSLSEVSDILLEDEFDLEVRLRFRTFTPTETQTRLTMNFLVNGIQ